jgi:hypothetical protein
VEFLLHARTSPSRGRNDAATLLVEALAEVGAA